MFQSAWGRESSYFFGLSSRVFLKLWKLDKGQQIKPKYCQNDKSQSIILCFLSFCQLKPTMTVQLNSDNLFPHLLKMYPV